MLREVEEGAEAVGAVHTPCAEVAVIDELALVVAKDAQAQVQAIATCCFEQLRDGCDFYKCGDLGILADCFVVVLDAVHKNLDDEALAAGGLDALDGLGDYAGTVFDARGAIGVVLGAVVAVA